MFTFVLLARGCVFGQFAIGLRFEKKKFLQVVVSSPMAGYHAKRICTLPREHASAPNAIVLKVKELECGV